MCIRDSPPPRVARTPHAGCPLGSEAMETTPHPNRPPGPEAPARTRVLILFGGRSGEHPISCATAGGVLRAIDRSRYDVVPVGITRRGRWVPAAVSYTH